MSGTIWPAFLECKTDLLALPILLLHLSCSNRWPTIVSSSTSPKLHLAAINTVPGARSVSKAPVTFRAPSYILKSKSTEYRSHRNRWRRRNSFRHRVKSFLFINLINRCVNKVVCASRYLYWSSSGDDICVSVSQKVLQCPFGMSDFLKHYQYFSKRFKLGRNLFRWA